MVDGQSLNSYMLKGIDFLKMFRFQEKKYVVWGEFGTYVPLSENSQAGSRFAVMFME